MLLLATPRLAAVLEVLGIYLAGRLVTNQLSHILNILLKTPLKNPLGDFNADITDSQLLSASREMLVFLLLLYTGWFLLIIPINWWHRRSGAAAYGLTSLGRSWKVLALAGLVTAALAEWPVLIVSLADSVYDLGETAAWRQAFFDTSWRRWEFWLFSGVMSWGTVAILEELFFRGYCQRRLAEDWGDGPAILGTACLFTFAHSQYLRPNAYSVGMILSLLTLAIGLGVVFAWTRSLVPSVLAHAIINVPMTPAWQGVLLASFLLIAAVMTRRGVTVVKEVFCRAGKTSCLALMVTGIAWAILGAQVDKLTYVAAAMVMLAVVLEAAESRRKRGSPSVGRSNAA